MATINMNVGGARRGTAPQFQITSPQGTAVSNILAAFTNQPPAKPAPAVPQQSTSQPSQPIRSGNRDASLSNMGNYAGTSNPLQAVKALQAMAMLSGDMEAAKLAGQIGAVGQIANANTPGQVAMAVAPTIANSLGIPGGVLGLGAAAVKGDIGMGVNSALNLANPMLGAANALFGLITGTTVGSAVNNASEDTSLGRTVLGTEASLVDSYSAGNAINTSPDPIGTLISQLSGTASEDSSETADTGFGSGNRGGGNFGGYGGGIGQSGGNAAGMGSTQA